MNDSWYKCKWVVPMKVNEVKTKCLTRPMQVTLESVASNILSLLHFDLIIDIYVRVNESWYKCESAASHTWRIYFMHINEWVMAHGWFSHAHIWTSHVAHINQSRHTYDAVMAHIRMRRVTHVNESRHTYTCVVVTRVNRSSRAYEWIMSLMRIKRTIRTPRIENQIHNNNGTDTT